MLITECLDEKLMTKISLQDFPSRGVSIKPCSLLFALHAMPSQVIDWKFLDKMSCYLQVDFRGEASIYDLQKPDQPCVD